MAEDKKTYDIDVLIVEDDAPSRVYISTVLKSMIRNTYTAVNGKEGLDLYEEHLPDVVVSDIGMPVLNGLEMSRRIKKSHPQALIILTTALDNTEAFMQAIEIGINQYILKPIKRSNLENAIERVYSTIRLRREIDQKNEYIRTLSRAVEHSSSMVMLLNCDGKIEYVNQKLLELTGYSLDEIIGTSPVEYKYSDRDVEQFKSYLETVSRGREWRGEYQNKKKNGEPYWVLSSISAIRAESGEITHLVVVSEDITERKKEEQQLEQSRDLLEAKVRERTKELRAAKEAAESANRAKSLFLAKVSHELRTPMNGILGMTSILLDTDLTDRQRHSLGIVKYSADSLLNIINDILDYSKLESGKLSISEHKFEPGKIIDHSINVIKNDVKKKGLELNTEIEPDIPPVLVGDSNRLRQILINLLNNAVKFTEKGSISLICSLEEISGEKAIVHFSVEDTGIGIPEEKIDNLFKSFSQIDGSLTRKYGGTGLGLAISRELIELMDGSIQVESEVGKGTRFFFTIPLGIAADAEPETSDFEEGQSLSEIAAQFPKVDLNILIAEDSDINQEVIREALRIMNWKSEIAADGYKAVEKFHSGEFDIILMDVQMPHMDGLEATRKIRNIEKSAGLGKTPVIGLTAHSDDSHKIDCYKAGMDYFVTKPYKWEDIYSAILNLTGHPVKSKRAANITKILDSLNKNSKVFAKVRDYFINKYPEELAELDMAITNKDCETAREIAHRIKSEVGNFGAEKAVELAGRIEQAGARKEMNQCKNYLSQLGKEFEKIEKQLTEYKI